MADISDVETALAGYCRDALSGLSGVMVARGWPTSSQLADALKAGASIVSIFSLSGHTRNSTRYTTEWRTLTPPAPTLVVSQFGSMASFSGTGGGGQLAGVKLDKQAWVHAVTDMDTPSTVAAALAAMVPGAASLGPVLSLPSASAIVRVAAPATVFRELERQWQGFVVTAWCPTPAARDAICSALGGGLAPFDFLTLPDGTAGWKQYEGTFTDDRPTTEGLWKRDLRYRIEYATVQTQQIATVLFPEATQSPLP